MLLIVKYSEYDYVMSDIYLVHICTGRIYYKKTDIYYKKTNPQSALSWIAFSQWHKKIIGRPPLCKRSNLKRNLIKFQVSPAPNQDVKIVVFFSWVCTLMFDFTYTSHKYHTHDTHSTSTNRTNHIKITDAYEQTSGQGRLFLWLRETAYNPQRRRRLSRTQRELNSQSSDRGNIVRCQLSSTFDSRHRDCPNKHSPKGGDNPSEMNMFNIGIRTQCAMAQGNTETDKYAAFALTNLITTCRLQNKHALILAVIRIARNWSTSGCAPPPNE